MKKSFARKIEENFGLVATFIGFVVDIITLLAFINTKITPSIPFIDKPLDVNFQLVLWIVSLITYFGFLREYWLRISRKLSTRPESTFGRFIIYDMVVRFKHPFLFVPFVILLGFFYPLWSDLTVSSRTFFVIVFILVILVISFASFIEQESKQANKEWQSFSEGNTFSVWINRIDKEIEQQGYATNIDLSKLYGERSEYCHKALWHYHRKFEIQKDLIFVHKSLKVRKVVSGTYFTETKELWAVAPRELASSEPWLVRWESKYFRD